MHHFHGSITKMQQKSQKVRWARPGFEPGTTRTLSEYHTPRPTSQRYYICVLSKFLFLGCKDKLKGKPCPSGT